MSAALNTASRPVSVRRAPRAVAAASLRQRIAEVGVLRLGINPRTGRPVLPFLRDRLDEIRGGLVHQLEVA